MWVTGSKNQLIPTDDEVQYSVAVWFLSSFVARLKSSNHVVLSAPFMMSFERGCAVRLAISTHRVIRLRKERAVIPASTHTNSAQEACSESMASLEMIPASLKSHGDPLKGSAMFSNMDDMHCNMSKCFWILSTKLMPHEIRSLSIFSNAVGPGLALYA
jgi:hypothetical protein